VAGKRKPVLEKPARVRHIAPARGRSVSAPGHNPIVVRSRDKEYSMMRPYASLAMVVLLSGCGTIVGSPLEGFTGFIGDTHTLSANPNRPASEGETVRRVLGQSPQLDPLSPEIGNVWPGPVEASASLADIARSNQGQLLKPDAEITLPKAVRDTAVNPLPTGAAKPVVATPQSARVTSPVPAAAPTVMPPVDSKPGPSPTPTPQAAPATRVIQTPNGPATLSGGGGVLTYTDQKGNTGLVVPNGNGTSTLIAPDGSVQTVATPK